ncbi:MAG: hypothetical protein AAGB93_04210 [Planctomycetota bacterium]
MLRVRPSAWWADRATVEDENGVLTRVRTSSWKEAAAFELDGRPYTVRRVGWPGVFTLRREGQEVATARRLSWFNSRIELTVEGATYGLKLRSLFRSEYVLSRRGRRIGSVRLTSWWTRRAEADFPDEIPRDVQVFAIWLVLAMWKRASN